MSKQGKKIDDSNIEYQLQNSPPICYISSKRPSLKWNGDPIYTITGITIHDNGHPSNRYLDQPLFTLKENHITSTNNPIINMYDCNPDFLLTLADRLESRDMPYPEAIRSKAINNIRQVFLNGATPRMFYEGIREYATVIFKDDAHPEIYRLDGKLFFKCLSEKNLLAFDIHDLLHHSVQLGAWPDQFQFVTETGYFAYGLPAKEQKTIRLRKLMALVWLACFEESLITIDNQLVSFGCLNWLSPSETPLDKQPNIKELSIDDQQVGFLWHYLDAFKDMYRIEMANSKLIGENLGWTEKLGYSINKKLKTLIESDNPRPFENLDYYDALKLEIQAPRSPEELFANAMALVRAEL